jgi:hypothetical protein
MAYLQTQAEIDLAREVWDVMDACNLSGVLRFWADKVNPVVNEVCKSGTDERNRHPFHVMMADKVAQLCCGVGVNGSAPTDAYWAVHKVLDADEVTA